MERAHRCVAGKARRRLGFYRITKVQKTEMSRRICVEGNKDAHSPGRFCFDLFFLLLLFCLVFFPVYKDETCTSASRIHTHTYTHTRPEP